MKNNNEIVYAGFYKRTWAVFIDILLFAGLLLLIGFFLTSNILSVQQQLLRTLTYIALCSVINIYSTVKYGGTIGKMTIGIEVVNEFQERITVKQAIIRGLPQGLYALIYLLRITFEYDQSIYTTLSISLNFIGIISLIDVITTLLNNKKRALHDCLAKTYVVESNEIIVDVTNEEEDKLDEAIDA